MSTEESTPDTENVPADTTTNPLKVAVVERLAELQLNPFAAATAAGLKEGFLRDILNGKKRTVRGENIGRLASALHITVEDLIERTGVVDMSAPPPGPLRGSSMSQSRIAQALANRPLAVDVARLRVLVGAAFEARGLSEEAARTLTEALIALARPAVDGAELEPAQLQALASALARGL